VSIITFLTSDGISISDIIELILVRSSVSINISLLEEDDTLNPLSSNELVIFGIILSL
jgi:hypothetical protein